MAPSPSLPGTVDEVAEWLRRWTANPMCSARVGSNPILVVKLFLRGPAAPLGTRKGFWLRGEGGTTCRRFWESHHPFEQE